MTLTSLEKRMLIYVLDLFDGGWGGAEALKASFPPLNPPLNDINKRASIIVFVKLDIEACKGWECPEK